MKHIQYKHIVKIVFTLLGLLYLCCFYLEVNGPQTGSAYRDIKRGNYKSAIEKLKNNPSYNDKNSRALLNYAFFLDSYADDINYPKVDKIVDIDKYPDIRIANAIELSPSKNCRYYDEIHGLSIRVDIICKEAEPQYRKLHEHKITETNHKKSTSSYDKPVEKQSDSGSYYYRGKRKSSSADAYDKGYDSVYMDEDYDYKRYRTDKDYARGVDDALDDLDEDW